MNKNLENIKNFFINNNKKILLLNMNGDGINIFYEYLLNYYANINNIALATTNANDNRNNNDFFLERPIYIIKTTSKKEIKLIFDNKERIILFADYKNFKAFKENCLTINTYNFENDLKYFLENSLKIHNKQLLNFLSNFPEYIYSEISKLFANTEKYESPIVSFDKNNLLEIRKKIYSEKLSNLKFYNLIKEELLYKKISFLIY